MERLKNSITINLLQCNISENEQRSLEYACVYVLLFSGGGMGGRMATGRRSSFDRLAWLNVYPRSPPMSSDEAPLFQRAQFVLCTS